MREFWKRASGAAGLVDEQRSEGEVMRAQTLVPTEEWVEVTPALAEEWLQQNLGNRKLITNRVMQFATDMESGRWVDRHPHGIAFDSTGRLLDGQHRLHAVTLSGVTVRMRVTFGLDPEMQSMFDLGAPRHTGEILRRVGVTDPNQVSSLVTTLFWYDNFYDVSWNSTPYPSKTWILEQAQEHDSFFSEAVRLSKSAHTARRVNRPAYGTLFILTQRDGLDDLWKQFHGSILTGAGLSYGDPRLTLINYFGHSSRRVERQGRWERQKALAMMLKSFVAYREGKSIKNLRFEMTSLPMPRL